VFGGTHTAASVEEGLPVISGLSWGSMA